MPLTNYRQIFMPYCIKKLGPDKWVVLNREYKPLGMSDRSRMYDYDSFAVKLKITKKLAEKLAILDNTTQSPKDMIFLYSASNPPINSSSMGGYLEKIGLLMNLKATSV
jgi:hypothetical protein